MTQPEQNFRIDYIEFPVRSVADANYVSFHDGRLAGGFRTEPAAKSGGPLVVIYALDLAVLEKTVTEAGGRIVRPTFSFPGGRRFHFTDPSGNELAVWTDR